MNGFGYSSGEGTFRRHEGFLGMRLLVQPVNTRGLLCFSGDRTLETEDTQLALSVEGVHLATLKTMGRTEDRYCLEVTLEQPLVCFDGIAELLIIIGRLGEALGLRLVHYVRGPERNGAGQEAPTFADWLILRES